MNGNSVVYSTVTSPLSGGCGCGGLEITSHSTFWEKEQQMPQLLHPLKDRAQGPAHGGGHTPVALTFHNQLSVVGHTGATIRADHTAVLAHTPLGSVGHADRGREAPVVDHAGDHEGSIPAVPLLQNRGREGEEISYHHMLLSDPQHRGSPWRSTTFHNEEFPWLVLASDLIQE